MLLDIKDLEFHYGDRRVLHDINFSAEAGSVVSILGPNGVGKTTLLKSIVNIHKPSSGSIFVDGQDVLTLSPKEMAKRVAYVPQSAIPGEVSVFDTVLMGRRPYIQWSATHEDMDKTWSAMQALKIDHLSLKHTNRISGGEFQKVQIARAVVQEPKILIMDEPTNNLDISNQHVTMHTIIDAVRSRGMCTIMTMHDINLAVHYSDVFVFIKDGTVVSHGGLDTITEETIKEVYGIEADVVYHKGKPFVIPQSLPPDLMHIHHSHDGHMHEHSISHHHHHHHDEDHEHY